MKIGDLHGGLGQLTHAFSDLSERWNEIKPHWTDSTAKQFEDLHLQPILPQFKLLMTAVQALQTAIDEAAAELSDKDRGES